jgi:hypothetical protein
LTRSPRRHCAPVGMTPRQLTDSYPGWTHSNGVHRRSRTSPVASITNRTPPQWSTRSLSAPATDNIATTAPPPTRRGSNTVAPSPVRQQVAGGRVLRHACDHAAARARDDRIWGPARCTRGGLAMATSLCRDGCSFAAADARIAIVGLDRRYGRFGRPAPASVAIALPLSCFARALAATRSGLPRAGLRTGAVSACARRQASDARPRSAATPRCP